MTARGAAPPMRPTLPLAALLLLASVLAGAVAFPAPARADDAPAAAPVAPAEDTAAAETREAEAIGRGMLADDQAVRRAAIDRLLARIARGGDLGAFLDALSRANRAWADRHERLMEVWLHDAVHGSAAERERAVRLLTALGEKAIRRLALELRHARLHEGAAPDAVAARVQEAETPQVADAEDDPGHELAIGTPRVYELRDLFARGMNPVELRSLLLKTADAVEVKQFKTQFVVTADDEGHHLLRARLHDLRVGYRLAQAETGQAEGAQAGADAKAAPAETPDVTGAKAVPAPPLVARDASDPPARAPAAPQPVATVQKTGAGAWRIEPTLVHVPRPALAGLGQGYREAPAAWAGLVSGGAARQETDIVRTTDAALLDTWTDVLRRVPDARAGLPLEGDSTVAAGGTASLFAGKSIRYSEDVRRTKGGAWTIVTGTIQHGIGVDVSVHAEPTLLRVDLVVTRTDVGLPIPVVRMQPSAQAAPVELERPEWSLTRVRRSFDLPREGGGALLFLHGLGDAEDDRLVLSLKLTPASGK